MYARDRDYTSISSGEFRNASPTSTRFPAVRALVAGVLALFIGSVVYWQIWFWDEDGTSLPALLAAAPLLLIALEYVIGRRPAIVGVLAGGGAGAAAYLAASSMTSLDGVYAGLTPIVVSAALGWLVFCLTTAGITRLVARRA